MSARCRRAEAALMAGPLRADDPGVLKRRQRRLLPLIAVMVTALTACGPTDVTTATATACEPTPAGELLPATGIYLGANIDWGRRTLADYATDLGEHPAVAVSFTAFPFGAEDQANLDAAVEQVRETGGLLLLTLEPRGGLDAVTSAAAAELAARLDGYNRQGVPVIVRFAHEMNGSWYAWGQQPDAYVAAFRRVAGAIHQGAPGTATMWAPNYGGGYPFTGGRYQASAGSADAFVLDTNGDSVVSRTDDPYAPYWPGDDAVDWVGMSLYHWGSTHPWGENEVPESGKLVAQLTGQYVGLGGDDRAVPDFYADYGEQHGKPVAIPETAALYSPDSGGADELAVKQAWWRQVYDPALHQQLPRLAMLNWFEWDKDEVEIGGRVDWTTTTAESVRRSYLADLPTWALWGDDVPACA